MKPIFINALVAMSIFLCSCSKQEAELNKVTASTSNLSTATTIVGRQQVITLATGDYYYPTSQALLWLPLVYDSTATKRYPLIISLGGIGQNGSSDINVLLNDSTIAKRIANGWNPSAVNPVDKKTYRFIVFSPTKNEPNSWGWSNAAIKVMLSELKQKYLIDTTRIYITGLSAGGWGTWTCVTEDTSLCKQFAALGFVSSAGCDDTANITNIDKYGIATWNICGTADSFYGLAVDYTNRINTHNPPIPAILTGLPGVGHSAWVQAYNPAWTANGVSFYQWLLKYKRTAK